MKEDEGRFFDRLNNGSGADGEAEKGRGAVRKRLILVAAGVLIMSIVVQSYLAVRTAERAVTEKTENYLIDKAQSVAEKLDRKAASFFCYMEIPARSPIIKNTAVSYAKRADALYELVSFDGEIREIALCDMSGNCFVNGGRTFSAAAAEWFRIAADGKGFVSEPIRVPGADTRRIVFALPVYGGGQTVTGVLCAFVSHGFFSEEMKDITVGHTGYCAAFGLTGDTVAHPDGRFTEKAANMLEEAAQNSALSSFKDLMTTALESDQVGVGRYTFMGTPYLAAYAPMNSTAWTVVVKAPEQEFMGAVNVLRRAVIMTGVTVALVSLLVISRAVRRFV